MIVLFKTDSKLGGSMDNNMFTVLDNTIDERCDNKIYIVDNMLDKKA